MATPERARILVVDDSGGMRRLILRVLAIVGLHGEACSDGREGLRRFRRSRHDLVITDLHMPDMDGADMMGRIRALVPSTPIIVISSCRAEQGCELVERARSIGPAAILTKPVDAERLLREVRGALGDARAMEETERSERTVR